MLGNCCADWLRRDVPEQKKLLTLDAATAAIDRASARAFVDALVDGDERVQSERLHEQVSRALARLDVGDRDLLTKYFRDPKAHRVLAALRGCTREALRQRAHRALERLRALMGPLAPARIGKPL